MPLPVAARAGERGSQRGRLRPPAHIGCSSRGGPGSTTTVGPGAGWAPRSPPRALAASGDGATTSPGAVPTGSSTVAPRGIVACLRLPARTASRSRLGKRVASRAHDLGDAPLERLVEHHLATLEAADDLGRQVVRRRPQPAAGHDDVDALPRHERERRTHVLGAVADDRGVRELDPQLVQAFGQPRPVAVADPARQHLGARDHDPRARSRGRGAHVHVGSCPGASVWRPVAFVIE